MKAFTLIGLVVTVVLGFIFLTGVTYLSKRMIERAKTIAEARQRNLRTNGLAECTIQMPEEEFWISDLPEEVMEEEAEQSFSTVASYRYLAATNLGGPWHECGELTADNQAMRSTMLELLSVVRETRPDLPVVFIRWDQDR